MFVKKEKKLGHSKLIKRRLLFAFILNIKLVPTFAKLFFNSLEKNGKCQKREEISE